jgi:hypothetical protein
MAAIKSGTEWNTPQRSALSVSSRNQRSTRFNHVESRPQSVWGAAVQSTRLGNII